MLVLGLLLVIAGTLVVLAAVFSSDGTAEMLGNELTTLTIFLLGVAAGLAILWGLTVIRFGARRELARRREHRRLEEISQKLDRVDPDRREPEPPGSDRPARDRADPDRRDPDPRRPDDPAHPDPQGGRSTGS